MINNILYSLNSLMRSLTALCLVPFMKVTGFRFSKDYRWQLTTYHRIVYAMVDTVGANIRAGIDWDEIRKS